MHRKSIFTSDLWCKPFWKYEVNPESTAKWYVKKWLHICAPIFLTYFCLDGVCSEKRFVFNMSNIRQIVKNMD